MKITTRESILPLCELAAFHLVVVINTIMCTVLRLIICENKMSERRNKIDMENTCVLITLAV